MSIPFNASIGEITGSQQATQQGSFTIPPTSLLPAGQFRSSSSSAIPTVQSSDASPPTARGGEYTNPATLCRVGQDVLQEIVQKTTEMFNVVQQTQLPNGLNIKHQQFIDRKNKLEDPVRRIKDLFPRLREIYDTVVTTSATIEPRAVEELIPIMEPDEAIINSSRVQQPVKYSSEEEKRLTELIRLKNRQLKEIIDHQRIVIAEINTMLTMKKTTSQDK